MNFATDLNDNDLKAIQYVHMLLSVFQPEIQVIYISDPVFVPDFREEKHEDEFWDRLEHLNLNRISFKTFSNNNIADQLKKNALLSDTDIIVLVHKRHSFLWGLINEKPVSELIKSTSIPLLILPENLVP